MNEVTYISYLRQKDWLNHLQSLKWYGPYYAEVQDENNFFSSKLKEVLFKARSHVDAENLMGVNLVIREGNSGRISFVDEGNRQISSALIFG